MAQAAGQVTPDPVDEIANLLQRIELSGRFNTKLACKPAIPGTLGRKVWMLTNLFPIRVKEDVAYHYDVTFKAEKKSVWTTTAAAGDDAPNPVYTEDIKVGRILKSLFEQMKQQDEVFTGVKAYFDGKQNMYVLRQKLAVDQKELTFPADMEGDKRMVRSKYFYTGHKLDLTGGQQMSRDSIQSLEIGIGYEAGRAMIQRGVKFFERSVPPTDLAGLNLELRMGFVKSLKATEAGLCVNLDRAAALFQKGGLMADVVMNIVNFTAPLHRQFTKDAFFLDFNLKTTLERELSNLRFEVRNPALGYSRKHRLERDSFTRQNVTQICFDWIEKDAAGVEIQERRRVSVKDYYAVKYKIFLKYPNLPCLAVGKDKKNFVPLEICYLIEEQYYDKKMNDRIQAKVTKATIQPPKDRFQQIKNSIRQLIPLAQKVVDCDIDAEPLKVEGRILDPPNMRFRNPHEKNVIVSQKPTRGNPCDFSWGTFNSSNDLVRWSIIQVQDNVADAAFKNVVHPNLVQFGRKVAENAASNGWNVSGKFGQFRFNYRGYDSLRNYMTAAVEKGQQQLLMFVMPSDQIYEDIKKIGNELGLCTQCIKLNVDDRRMMDERGKINDICKHTYVANVVMKMNAKFGGTNAKLAVMPKPPFPKKVMIVGMDVFHPGEGSAIKESLVGIVASFTPCFTRYYQAAKAQPQVAGKEFKRKEEIGNDIVLEVLVDFFKRWHNENKFYPENVLVFRDGVSEGQFEQVRLIELDQIYRAMTKLGFAAKVTFITVQKKHHFRMFSYDATGVANPLPGTVIDTRVVHPERFECYLNSHHALKGTAKPSHYCVVHNEIDLSADQVQAIAYYLCYLCARCYKPISIPIPVKYAHLVAEQASKNVASALRQGLPGNANEWIRVHENFTDKLNYA